jgi:hypothetical protein
MAHLENNRDAETLILRSRAFYVSLINQISNRIRENEYQSN